MSLICGGRLEELTRRLIHVVDVGMTETLWHPNLDNLEARRIILTGR